MTVRGWQLTADWSDSGTNTGPLEDVSSYVDRGTVTVEWGRPTDGVALEAPTGAGEFDLINRTPTWDRYFSPENASSPIYGKVLPGKRVGLRKTVRGDSVLLTESWSSAGAGLNGWAAVSGGTATRVSSPSEDGNGSLQYVPPGGVGVVGVSTTTTRSIITEPAGTVVITFRIMSSSTWTDVRAAVDWYDITGSSFDSDSSDAFTSGTAWTTVSFAFTPPPTTTGLRPRVRIGSTAPNTVTFNVDSITVRSVPDDSGRTYLIHDGLLDDFSVDPTAVDRKFSGKTVDAWGRPTSAAISTEVYSGVRTGDAIGIVLDKAGWTGARDLDPGATLINWWWEEGTDPASAVTKLVNSEGPPAIAYVEGGTFVFRDRHHRVRTSLTSVATFTHISPPGPQGADFKIEKGTFLYDHGLKSIVNSVSVSSDIRTPDPLGEVWTQEEPIAMASSTTMTVFAQPSDPVINAVAPTMESGDLQADSGTFTATIDRASGQKFIITITCVGAGVLTRVALRGNPLTIARSVVVNSSDVGSIGRYHQEIGWPVEMPWVGPYDAQTIADRIVTVYADNRPRVTFTVVALNDRYTSMMLALRISDRITVRNDVLGVNADFHVEHLQHQVAGLNLHRLTVSAIRAEPTQPSNVFTFDTSGKGFNDGLFGTQGIDSASTMFVFDQSGQGFDQGFFAN